MDNYSKQNDRHRKRDSAGTKPRVDDVTLIKRLLDWLEKGFQNPILTLQYLRSRQKCTKKECQTEGCWSIVNCFLDPRPWKKETEEIFFNGWAWRWYAREYEMPINAVFTYPIIFQFLKLELGWDEPTILKKFKFEFKGKVEGKELPVPTCLYRGEGITQIKGKACDFYLLPPLPTAVAEVKVASSLRSGSPEQFFKTFETDITKCKEWLRSKDKVKLKFGVEGFEYGIAIFIDLTDGDVYRNLWNQRINGKEYEKERIITRIISANFG